MKEPGITPLGEKLFSRPAISLTGLLLLLLLGGCAAPASYQAMVPSDFQAAKKHAATVKVAATGGRETQALGKSQISDAEFAKALTEAITESRTFSRVMQDNGADYLLTVSIISIEQPSFGFSFQVKMEAGWTLKQMETDKVVWQESIVSEYTATPGDAFAAVKRLRLATEGAAKNNIAEGLSRISKLSL
jgi:hypothetical protein